ncbi:translocation/assembly module TamB domain-containing protein [Geomonas ferrireducens]|uniref:hypothetical protein n=1 Tax=Geomonas ferrireducens TaxID=2570227 RepID=UPI0010A784F4|nr:hypothetical protein [Geomonas ferrireducens]
MRPRLLAYISTIRLRRVLLVGSAVALAGLLLLALLLVSLPTLISTSPVQSLLRLGISKALKRPISWDDLTASWSRGIAISGLNLGEGPPPLLHAALKELKIVPGLSREESSGRWRVSLEVKLAKLDADLAPGPQKPKEKLPDPLTRIAEGVQKFHTMEWPLPVEVRAMVEAAPMTLRYADPESKRELLMNNFAFGLAVPSLSTLPVTASLTGEVAVDGGKAQPVRLKVRVADLVTAAHRIKPSRALFAVQAGLPGADFDVKGGVSRPEGLKARLQLSLAEVMKLAAPLAKKPLPELGGALQVALDGETDQAGDLRLALALDGERLSVSKLPGKRGKVAPLDLRLRQKLKSDHKRQQVTFSEGSLASPGLLTASWSAVVDRPTEKSRAVSVELSGVRLELSRAAALAAPFLGKALPLKDLTGNATLAKLTARFKGPENDGEVAVSGLALALPRLSLKRPAGAVQGEKIVLSLDRAVLPLKKMTPVRATAELSLSAATLEAAGKKLLRAQGVRGRVALNLSGIDLKGKRAVADATQSLGIERLAVGEDLAFEKLREEVSLKGRVLSGGAVDASLPLLNLEAASLRARQGARVVTLRPFAARLAAEGVHLPAKGKGSPTVAQAHFTLAASDALTLTAQGALTGEGRQLAATKGEAHIDLRRLMPVAAPFLPAGFDAAGLASAAWDLSLPLPLAQAPAETNPLRKAKGGVALLERGELTVKLNDMDLKLPAAQGGYRIKGLSTAPQLRFSVPRADLPLAIDGGVRFAALEGLTGAAATLPLQSGALKLQGELSGWKELRLTEELTVASLGLSQVAELTVGRLDALMDERELKLDTATLLKRLDATMFAHLEGNFPPEAKQVIAGWRLAGNVAAGARVDLTAAKELKVRGYGKCRDLGVADGKGVGADGMRADLVLDRTYALAQGKGESWEPLSTALVRPAPVAPFAVANSDLANRIYQDLRGESSGPRKIGVRSASFRSGALPLAASALEADLLLEPESLGLSFFQAEFAGGTVRARGMIDLTGATPVLSTYCNFSRLDPVLLFPAAGSLRPGGEGELTGELSLSAPLATEKRALLEGMRMNLNLRRFSSRVLDRALFAVDPYQRNEKIVAQRKALKMADLKGLRVSAVDGALDCEGELAVKGVDVAIPRIDRLRLSELPIDNELKSLIQAIRSSQLLLDLVRSDTLVVDEKGKLSLKRRKHAE